MRRRITTAHAIDELLADATSRGIFDVVVQVRGRGDAYYRSKLEPQALALAGTDLDPLDHLTRFGATVGVRIHAWGNVFFVWSDKDGTMPGSPAHLVNRHADWLLRPGGVKYLDPVGGSDWEGIYIDPANPAAREHTLAVFTDIVSRYPVEGFHYDYVRYPQVTYAASPNDHEHVTALVRESAARLRRARPGIVISAAVFPDPGVARDRVLQHSTGPSGPRRVWSISCARWHTAATPRRSSDCSLERAPPRRIPRCGAVSWPTKVSGSCCAIRCAPCRARAAREPSSSPTTPIHAIFWMFSPRLSGGVTLLSPCRTNRHQHRSQRRRLRSRAVPTRSPRRWRKVS